MRYRESLRKLCKQLAMAQSADEAKSIEVKIASVVMLSFGYEVDTDQGKYIKVESGVHLA